MGVAAYFRPCQSIAVTCGEEVGPCSLQNRGQRLLSCSLGSPRGAQRCFGGLGRSSFQRSGLLHPTQAPLRGVPLLGLPGWPRGGFSLRLRNCGQKSDPFLASFPISAFLFFLLFPVSVAKDIEIHSSDRLEDPSLLIRDITTGQRDLKPVPLNSKSKLQGFFSQALQNFSSFPESVHFFVPIQK